MVCKTHVNSIICPICKREQGSSEHGRRGGDTLCRGGGGATATAIVISRLRGELFVLICLESHGVLITLPYQQHIGDAQTSTVGYTPRNPYRKCFKIEKRDIRVVFSRSTAALVLVIKNTLLEQ